MGKNDIDFFLKHKDINVAHFSVEGIRPKHVIFNNAAVEHIPFGAQLNMVRFHEWWDDRSVPRTRQGAKSALKKLGYQSTGLMLLDNLALSLTDCYWICPDDTDIKWSDINLYENPFVDYFGEITINKDADVKERSKFSLATSQGEVRKKWVIKSDGCRAMVKGNWADSYQQSINEAFATLLHKKQDRIPYTTYSLLPLDVKNNSLGLGCICDLYTDNNTEFISAWEIMRNTKMRSHDNHYLHFKNQCIKNGMDEKYFDEFMSYEILTDILLTNTDRHMNNIGILRNPDTLKWYGFAPIYDNGNSMFFRDTELLHIRLDDIKIHSFFTREKKMAKYVRYPDIVNLDKLPTKEEFRALYEKDIPERHSRIEATWTLFQKKVNYIRALQHK